MNPVQLFEEIVSYHTDRSMSSVSTVHSISYLEFNSISELLRAKYNKYSIDVSGDAITLIIPKEQN